MQPVGRHCAVREDIDQQIDSYDRALPVNLPSLRATLDWSLTFDASTSEGSPFRLCSGRLSGAPSFPSARREILEVLNFR